MTKELPDALSALAAVSSLLALIVSVCAAALAAYFGPYLKKKAEARAKAEDFEHYLDLLVRQTSATERIKSQEAASASVSVEVRKSALAQDVANRTERLKAALVENIERMKGDVQAEISHLAQVFTPRLDAYRSLWALTVAARFDGPEHISPETRQGLAAAMTSWYYENGNGLCLSQRSTDLWLSARALLSTDASDSAIRSAFSALRGQLKDDIGVYGPALKRQAKATNVHSAQDDA